MTQHAEFADVGKRMLHAWSEGIHGLRDERVYSMAKWSASRAFAGFSDPPRLAKPRRVVGRSEGLGRRNRKP
jgi:serine/threonine-protein kinase HipA